jgi:hypothetical protein
MKLAIRIISAVIFVPLAAWIIFWAIGTNLIALLVLAPFFAIGMIFLFLFERMTQRRKEIMYRWVLRGFGAKHPARLSEDVLRHVAGIVLDFSFDALTADYYVSRQGSDVWLTVFADEKSEGRIVHKLEPLPGWCRRINWSKSDHDVLLRRSSRRYRHGLRITTDIALGLVLQTGSLVSHQCFFIQQMFTQADPRTALERYFTQHSAEYSSLGIRSWGRYWDDFFSEGPAGLSYYGHWLWNIVVGPHPPPPGAQPADVAQAIGITCPQDLDTAPPVTAGDNKPGNEGGAALRG